jgi:hypothetical protein
MAFSTRFIEKIEYSDTMVSCTDILSFGLSKYTGVKRAPRLDIEMAFQCMASIWSMVFSLDTLVPLEPAHSYTTGVKLFQKDCAPSEDLNISLAQYSRFEVQVEAAGLCRREESGVRGYATGAKSFEV